MRISDWSSDVCSSDLASMGIFDAWCDRTPIVILGATGPLDASKRRPWIEWIHCTIDKDGLARNFTTWNDEQGPAEAAMEANRRTTPTAPCRPVGPVTAHLDVTFPESTAATSTTRNKTRYDLIRSRVG